jgi:hypothetical protein
MDPYVILLFALPIAGLLTIMILGAMNPPEHPAHSHLNAPRHTTRSHR